jgi:hypothetical protein
MPYRLVFRVHALQRMFQRHISTVDVKHVLETGQVIREYPDDTPYPSRLILGWVQQRPIHVVIAEDQDAKEQIIITVYEPDSDLWDVDFRRKRP